MSRTEPMEKPAARIHAKAYVAALLARGYDHTKARAESHFGEGGPREPGFSITRGTIMVPGWRGGHAFNFHELEKEIAGGNTQPELF